MKYQTQLSQIHGCPPQHSTTGTLSVYRFVFSPIDDKSFIPQGLKSPSRIMSAKNNHEKCSLFALSMFDSANHAIEKYKKLMKISRNINKSIGTHLATGTIQPLDGLHDHPNSEGHFDFYEKAGIDLTPKFTIIQAL